MSTGPSHISVVSTCFGCGLQSQRSCKRIRRIRACIRPQPGATLCAGLLQFDARKLRFTPARQIPLSPDGLRVGVEVPTIRSPSHTTMYALAAPNATPLATFIFAGSMSGRAQVRRFHVTEHAVFARSTNVVYDIPEDRVSLAGFAFLYVSSRLVSGVDTWGRN